MDRIFKSVMDEATRYAESDGVAIQFGRLTDDRGKGEMRTSVRIIPSEGLSSEEAFFRHDAPRFRLAGSLYQRTIYLEGTEYVIIGINANSPKNMIIIRDMACREYTINKATLNMCLKLD